MSEEIVNIAETMRQTVEELAPHEVVNLGNLRPFHDAHIITHAAARTVENLTDEHRNAAEYLKPARRRGTAKLATLDSLIDWANRFKGESSVLFVDPKITSPSLTCIANYHGQGPAVIDQDNGDATAQHCDHRGVYSFPMSKEWIKWAAISNTLMGKDEMGQFIEDNAKDILDPTPALLGGSPDKAELWEERMLAIAQKIQGRFGQHSKLIEMSREFLINETSNLQVTSNRDTGESTINFVNEHQAADGKPLRIPNLFLIAIPVFESGALYRLPIRFQYRKKGGAVLFMFSIYDPESAFDDALNEAVNKAAADTGMPLLSGTPET